MDDDLMTALAGGFFVTATCADGTRGKLYPAIAADGEWHVEVPDGVISVAGLSVQPGDTVSGVIAVSVS